MSNEDIPSTEATKVDLVALRNWHFKASMHPDRDPAMRRWHRRQADIITRKLHAQSGTRLHTLKVAMIEVLSDFYRGELHEAITGREPFNWERACAEARARAERGDYR
jgi:hypothetical protein